MNDRDANRLEMFRTVDATLNLPAHLAVWQNQPPAIFTTQVTQFRGLLADLEATLVARQADITGRAERKRREEEELEWIAFSTGAALAVYYLTQQREDLAAEVDFPLSNWQGLRDADLIARSHLVLNRLRGELAGGSPNPNPGGGTITVTDVPTNDPPISATASLASYDLTTVQANELERELQEYETLVSSPHTSRAARAALTEALKPHFAAINKHLELMDRIILRYRATPAGTNFHNAWTNARQLIDRGHGPSTPPDSPAPETPEPTAA